MSSFNFRKRIFNTLAMLRISPKKSFSALYSLFTTLNNFNLLRCKVVEFIDESVDLFLFIYRIKSFLFYLKRAKDYF